MKSDFKAALDNCEREPVHIPGSIQPFAALIAFDTENFLVFHFTPNAITFTNVIAPEQSILNREISDLFSNRELIHAVRGALGLPTIQSHRERLGIFQLNDRPVDAAVHISGSQIVLELEDAPGSIERSGTSISRVRTMLGALTRDQGYEPLLETAVKVLRHLTGFDRVMGYRFLNDGSGEVSAEEVAPGLKPFLGLRYPAHDIPPQVRRIALSSPVRVIHDTEQAPLELISNSETPLDLTLCHNRAVSPIHVEYLRNMGIRSTMNFSIIVHGELWGLFAFHHHFPRLLSPDYRAIAELFSQLFSMQLQQELDTQALSRRRAADAVTTQLRHVPVVQSVKLTLDLLSCDLMDVVKAQGIAFKHQNEIYTSGNCPERNAIDAISQSVSEELLAIESIQSVTEYSTIDSRDLNACGGFLSILLDQNFSQLIFFRNEINHEIRWGGMPEKNIEYGPNGPRLHPRSSFDEYIEKIAGHCEPWTQEDFSTITELRAAMLELLYRNIRHSSREWNRQKQHQDVLIAELNHRVKNILALVLSIVRQTRDQCESLEEYVASLEERITALLTAHDLVGGSSAQWISVKQLFEIELSAYLNVERSVILEGPEAALRSDVAPIMALAIHELTSNAVKHGALAASDGVLEISWRTEKGRLKVHWKETIPNPIPPLKRHGFGLTLINRVLSHEDNGETSVQFHERGLEVNFWVPRESYELRTIADIPEPAQLHVDKAHFTDLNIDTVLVVEDNLIISLEMERIFTDMNCKTVRSAASIEEAINIAEMGEINLAIIDVNMNGTPSFSLADRLIELQIPFVFMTGYGNRFPLPENLNSVPRLLKPVNVPLLHHTINELMNSQS
ncbi:Bacteriophytochrome [Polystyrenella longa]|uniref:histidine kinase n=1 Tax=Polystyrenella longa TaxID=2528007 RepID=A0A518CLE0_9PLAN|nr:HWE histidine kinase domain-containing protein [Polystyrenella longa]QDU80036.1 Bacteriophytochrome [Polystyrenella longa]